MFTSEMWCRGRMWHKIMKSIKRTGIQPRPSTRSQTVVKVWRRGGGGGAVQQIELCNCTVTQSSEVKLELYAVAQGRLLEK